MFLKSKWKNLSVKKKIFIWSSLVITVSFTLLYIFMYLFMPRVYEIYEISKLNSNILNLKLELQNDKSLDLNEILDEFSYENNLDVIVVSKNKKNYIDQIIYSSFRDGIKNPGKIPFLDNYAKYRDNDFQFGDGFKIKLPPFNINPKDYVYKLNNKEDRLTIEKEIYIKSLNKTYNMIIHLPDSPENEAMTSLKLFFPFAITAIIIIALTISGFYSLIISKPLIKINKVAKKMANLDFDNIIEIKGEDEIGQLSKSLNLMNKNLKEAFDELEIINSKLTEEIEMERKLEKQRREFIATISHELKSPITIISGQLEGMIYNIGKYKDRDKYLKESYKVTEQMRDLVQEILNLGQRENGEFKYNFKDVNISNLIKYTLKELQYFIDEKNLKLEISIAENIIIKADENLMKKAITNVIKNAINYSPINEKVIIKLDKKRLSIENTGVTIPKAEINEIFNAFYRVDKSRNRRTGGTGLGLYIVKSILDEHKNIEYKIQSKENSVLFVMDFKD